MERTTNKKKIEIEKIVSIHSLVKDFVEQNLDCTQEIKTLLENKADPYAKDRKGKSAFDLIEDMKVGACKEVLVYSDRYDDYVPVKIGDKLADYLTDLLKNPSSHKESCFRDQSSNHQDLNQNEGYWSPISQEASWETDSEFDPGSKVDDDEGYWSPIYEEGGWETDPEFDPESKVNN